MEVCSSTDQMFVIMNSVMALMTIYNKYYHTYLSHGETYHFVWFIKMNYEGSCAVGVQMSIQLTHSVKHISKTNKLVNNVVAHCKF